MQKNYRILIILFAAITGTLFFQSCSKDDNPIDEPEKEVVPKETQKVTQFAIDVLQDVYLWSSTIKSVDVTKIKDPVVLPIFRPLDQPFTFMNVFFFLSVFFFSMLL